MKQIGWGPRGGFRVMVLAAAVVALWGAPGGPLGAGAARAQTAGGKLISPRQHVIIGDERMAQGNYLGAAFQYERAIDQDANFLEAYYKLAHAYTQAGRTYPDYLIQAQAVYERVLPMVGPDDAEFRKNIADLYLARWEVDEALGIFEDLIAQSPEDCEYWLLLGNAERLKAIQLQETAGMEASQVQLDVAEKTYRKALAQCPDRFEAIHGLATVLDSRKRYADVVALYQEQMKEHPGNVEMLRGYALATFNARDWETAAKAFGELVEKDPRPEERLIYISALRKLNRLEEADAQGDIYKATAPQFHGPQQLLPVDILREELGVRQASERAVARIDAGDCAQAVAIWSEVREKARERLEDPKFGGAAEELVVWLDRRILYAEGKCK